MSSPEIVRKPLRVRDARSTRRAFEHRLVLRFPRLAVLSGRMLARLPPSSRLRQAFVWRMARVSAEAFNRRDFDAQLTAYHPDCEFHSAPTLVEAGLAVPFYRGPDGYREFVASWSDVWGPDVQVHPVELIDMGTRIVALYDVPVRGQASGVQFTGKFATVSELKDGRVIRDRVYFDHADALEAAGVPDAGLVTTRAAAGVRRQEDA